MGVIIDPAIGIGVKRIDGEIAAQGIMAEIAPEPHGGVAAMGFDILAQTGDLERPSVDHQRHRAMRQPCRHGFDTGLTGFFHHRFGQMGGRHVDIGDGAPHQRIAHHTADQPHTVIIVIEQGENPPHGRIIQQQAQRGRNKMCH